MFEQFRNCRLVERYGSVAILHCLYNYSKNTEAEVAKCCGCGHFKQILLLNCKIFKIGRMLLNLISRISLFVRIKCTKWSAFGCTDMPTHVSLFIWGSVSIRPAADLRLSTGTDTVDRVRDRAWHTSQEGERKNCVIKIQDIDNSYSNIDVNDLGTTFYRLPSSHRIITSNAVHTVHIKSEKIMCLVII